MNSPFPGMDPYLESRWSDVHLSMLAYIKESLQPSLPFGLRARAEERILLEDQGDAIGGYRSDVAIVEKSQRHAPAAAGAVMEHPAVVVEFTSEPEVDRWVQIIDTHDGNRVITAIELLSPGNKAAGNLNRLYRKKVRDYARAGVNLVEIDLLRSRRTRLKVKWSDIPPDRRALYLLCVRRARTPERWECFPASLRDTIPAVPIPLRASDGDVLLSLQPLLERAYTAGAHDDIDYSKPLDPPLSAEDEAWADQLLRSAGRRK